MRHVPARRLSIVAAAIVVAAEACALMLALQHGALWPAAVSGGVVSGLLLAVAWSQWPEAPRFAAVLTGSAVVPAGLLALMSPAAGTGGVAVAAMVVLGWTWAARPRTSLRAH